MQSYAGLYIGNLDSSITTDLIFTFFSRYNIINIHHPYNHLLKQHKPFAFVYFKNQESGKTFILQSLFYLAKKAFEECKYEKILNKPIRLSPILNFKQIDKNANVFIKNVDLSVTWREFDEYFKKFGDIITSTLRTDENGESLGYGYVQFHNAGQAQKCIQEANGNQLGDRDITVELFKTKPLRNTTNTKNNLYFKDLKPLMEDEEAGNLIKQKFSEYGNITSMITKKSVIHNGHWGFVCFDKHESAQASIENLHDQDVFNTGEPFYCGWAMTKAERQRSYANKYKTNETKLYIRSLKIEVTAEALKQAFSIFGTPVSASVRECQLKQEGNKTLKFGFVEMSSKEEATAALQNGPQCPDILALSVVNPVYIKFAQPKAVRQNYMRLLKEKSRQQQLNSMFNFGQPNRQFPNMQMFNPMMMIMMKSMYQQMMQQGGGQRGQYHGGYGNRGFRGNNRRGQNNYNGRFNGQRRGQRGGPHQQRHYGGYRGNQNQQPYNKGGQQPMRNQAQQQKPNQGFPNQNQQQFNVPKSNQEQKPPQQQPQPQVNANQPPQQQKQSVIPPQQQTKPQPQPPKQQSQQPLLQQSPQQSVAPVQLLEQRMGEFQNLNPQQQRNILGEMFFPVVRKYSPQYAPKITGMLIDLDVSTIDEILNLLKNEMLLREKVQSAEALLRNQEQGK